MEFDPDRHEKEVAERYARLAKYDAFDRFIDMALDPDSPVTRAEAIGQFAEEYADPVVDN